jgi:hypothetical protein
MNEPAGCFEIRALLTGWKASCRALSARKRLGEMALDTVSGTRSWIT